MLLESMVVAALSASPLVAHSTDAIPIQEFVRHAQYTASKISPDGRFLALTVQQGDRMALAVLRMRDMQVNRITRLTDRESISAFYWVGPDRLMYTPTSSYTPRCWRSSTSTSARVRSR